MGARGRLALTVAVVSLAQGLNRYDPRMPGEDERLTLRIDCDTCAEPLRIEKPDDLSAMCRNQHLNFLDDKGPDKPPRIITG